MAEFILPKWRVDRDAPLGKLERALQALPIDKAWVVKLEEQKPKRTLSQNRMLWALYGDILRLGGEAMAGWTADDLHEFFLSSHFGTEKKEVFGKVRQVPLQRSAKLERKQFAEFVDFIIRFMAQQGVVLGLPEGM